MLPRDAAGEVMHDIPGSDWQTKLDELTKDQHRESVILQLVSQEFGDRYEGKQMPFAYWSATEGRRLHWEWVVATLAFQSCFATRSNIRNGCGSTRSVPNLGSRSRWSVQMTRAPR